MTSQNIRVGEAGVELAPFRANAPVDRVPGKLAIIGGFAITLAVVGAVAVTQYNILGGQPGASVAAVAPADEQSGSAQNAAPEPTPTEALIAAPGEAGAEQAPAEPSGEVLQVAEGEEVAEPPEGAQAEEVHEPAVHDPSEQGSKTATWSGTVAFPATFGPGSVGGKVHRKEVSAFVKQGQACAGKIVLVGHADETGDQEANLTISQARAEYARSVLVREGISETKIEVRGAGSTDPVASNETPHGRAQNRRVTVACE
jgi:outer membrane protein OmpA-like peptidoglycan-associated protein